MLQPTPINLETDAAAVTVSQTPEGTSVQDQVANDGGECLLQMRVSCPECDTSFRLDGSKIPLQGSKAQCSVCSAIIHLKPLSQPRSPEHAGAPPEAPPPPGVEPPSPSHTEPPSEPAPAEESPTVHQIVHSQSREEMLDMMLVAERERREMAWEMTRELFRLREVVERQQTVVSGLVEAVTNKGMTAGTTEPPAAPPEESGEHATLLERQRKLEEELQHLQETLESEKEVVERLRHGKLELERRTAHAEETIMALRQRGFLQRLLGRNH